MTYALKLIFFCIFFCSIYNSEGFCSTYLLYFQKDSINQKDANELKQGLWIISNEGTVVEEGRYVDNLKQGVWTSYYEDGTKKSEINYIADIPNGNVMFYYPNGKIRESGNWQEDHWVGNYKYYYESGQISYNWNYNKKGKRDGKQIYYHENGTNMYVGFWSEGKTEGTLKAFNENGDLIQEKIYTSGKLSMTKDMSEIDAAQQDDRLEQRPKHQMDKFTGTGQHTIINMSGKVEKRGYFVKGLLLDGEKFNYNEEGKLVSVTIYKNGEETRTSTVDQSN